MRSVNKQQVVIVGGGFAGLNLIKHLDKTIYDIILIDKNNYHTFPPLFYQIASSGLEPASICFPFRQEVQKLTNVRYCMAELLSIHDNENFITTTAGEIEYDYLVIATGTTNNFFGNNDLEDHVYTMKSTSEAISLRNQILASLEKAATCVDKDIREASLCFVVIGAGPTGVEVAGALGEMKKFILAKEYPDIDKDEVRVVLVEGSDRLLRTMSSKASEKSLLYLKQLEVEVQLNKTLTHYDGEIVTFNDGSSLNSNTVIWTAGVTGEKIKGFDAEIINRSGRLYTDDFNRVKKYTNIFAIGDISCIMSEKYPQGHPQVAQVAIQQAHNLAHNLNSIKNRRPFIYNDKGSMATIGRNRAVVDLPHMRFQGRIAWLVWMFVHLLSILGMKNKIFTFTNWVWNYFTYNASLRLLIKPAKKPLKKNY